MGFEEVDAVPTGNYLRVDLSLEPGFPAQQVVEFEQVPWWRDLDTKEMHHSVVDGGRCRTAGLETRGLQVKISLR